MKTIYELFAIIILMLLTNRINAQSTELSYTLNSNSISFMGQNIVVSSTLAKSGNTFIWNQQADDDVESLSFNILNTSEEWNQETSTGSNTYTMTLDNLQAVLVLTGSNSGLNAVLTLTANISEVETYIFNINSISYQ